MNKILVITYAVDEELDRSSIEKKNVEQYNFFNDSKTLFHRIIDNIKTGGDHREVVLLKTRIGKTNTSSALSSALALCKHIYKNPEITVLNVGTAASVDIGVGSVVECLRFEDRDLLKLDYGDKRDHIIDFTTANTPDYDMVRCLSGDSFVTSDADIDKNDDFMSVCDMEAFSQARVCQIFGVKFICYKYVTDHIGTNSVHDWEKELPSARKVLTDICLDSIEEFYHRD